MFRVSTKMICGEELEIYTDDKSKIFEIENYLISVKYEEHNKNCKMCKNILQNRKIEKIKNSYFKVQTKTNCGEILYIQRRLGEFPNYNVPKDIQHKLESHVVDMAMNHSKNCIICNRKYKLNHLNNIQKKNKK